MFSQLFILKSMAKRHFSRVFLATILIQTFALNVQAESVAVSDPGNHPVLVQAVKQVLSPLPEGDPMQWQDKDLKWLDDYANVRVLALGEATHGTREFITARQRMFQYLVENSGFRVLAVEGHFTECLYLDRCLADPDCLLEKSMQDRMLIWTTKTTEMLDLFKWIRSFNQDRPESDWIHYVGYDSQVRDQITDLLNDLLKDQGPELLTAVHDAFEPVSELNRAAYQEMDDTALASHRERLASLSDLLTNANLEKKLGKYNKTCVLQLVKAAYQSLEFLQQYFHHNKLVRDSHLTENVLWTSELFGEDTKVVLWAHNAHIAVHKGYALDAGGGMGWQLRQKLGADYRSIGLVFSRGEFRAKVFNRAGEVTAEPANVVFVVDPPAGSLNCLLEGIDSGSFFLDFARTKPESDLGQWLAAERPVLGVGDLFLGYEKISEYHYGGDRVLSPANSFDALLYLADTHATEALPPLE